MCHSLFICSLPDGSLGSFQILATVNNAAVNIGGTYSFESVSQVSLGIFPEVESLSQKAVPIFNF